MQLVTLLRSVAACLSMALSAGAALVAGVSYAAPPSATALDPTSLTGDTAVFNATVNPGNLQTTVRFRWIPGTGTCTGGTEVLADQSPLAAGIVDVPVTARITGLVRGTVYTICVTASNASGSAQSVKVFTSPNTPIVITVGPSQVGATTATIVGLVNPSGATATAWVRHSSVSPGAWCNESFGTRAPAAGGTALAAGTVAKLVQTPVTGLTQTTPYYVCAVAQNAAGISFGDVVQVSTSYAALDVDRNGVIDTNTDGLLVVRYLLGLRGSALIAGALGTNATRTDPIDIAAHLQSLTQ